MFFLGFITGVISAVVVISIVLWLFHKNPPNFLPW
jgi:hypothetical protein